MKTIQGFSGLRCCSSDWFSAYLWFCWLYCVFNSICVLDQEIAEQMNTFGDARTNDGSSQRTERKSSV